MNKELNQRDDYEEEALTKPTGRKTESISHKSSWADALEEEDVELVNTSSAFSMGVVKDWVMNNKLIAGIAGGVIALILIVIIIVVVLNAKKTVEEPEVTTEEPDYSWMDEPEATPEPEVFTFTYPEETYVKLRAAGFTARQIEELEAKQTDVTPYLKKAAEKKKEWAAEQFKALLRNSEDSTDLQYTYIMGNTYLGLEPQEIDPNNDSYSVVAYKENVNYWKMPMQGWQPTIKIRLKSGEILYYQVTPQRFVTLDDSGSMAISYTVSEIYGAKFITDIKEVGF